MGKTLLLSLSYLVHEHWSFWLLNLETPGHTQVVPWLPGLQPWLRATPSLLQLFKLKIRYELCWVIPSSLGSRHWYSSASVIMSASSQTTYVFVYKVNPEQMCSNFSGSRQFSSFSQFCLTLCDPMDCSTPGFPVHHQLLELSQTHVHWVSDAIQPSHLLLSLSTLAFNLSQSQGLFQWVGSSHQAVRVLEFQLQHQSFQWIFRTNFL